MLTRSGFVIFLARK